MKLEIQGVTKKYPNKTALQNLSLTFEQGVTGLLGPNGAGKSTLMRMISTIDIPTSGTIKFNNEDITRHPDVIRNVLGYLPQDFGVYPNMTAVEFLQYMAAVKGVPMKVAKGRINELLEVLHLSSANKRQLGGFSGGMRQRVGIAQALLNEPEILIVDEPTVGLDPEERIQFRNLLASIASERIIILSTHIVSDIESIAPQIAIMKNGSLLFHETPEKLISQTKGKVWSCVVSLDKFNEIKQEYMVSNAMQMSTGIYAKIIASKQPTIDARSIEPTLEDAYLVATTKKEG